jgi:hypothetical protein
MEWNKNWKRINFKKKETKLIKISFQDSQFLGFCLKVKTFLKRFVEWVKELVCHTGA